jgi:hypothetical protein
MREMHQPRWASHGKVTCRLRIRFALHNQWRWTRASDWRVIQLHAAAAGIIGAGTNNARLAGLLRSLSAYYAKEPQLLFLVRVAQGLVHMGKGLLTLSPHHAHGQLLSGGLTGNMMYMRNHVKLLHGGIPLTALGRHAMPA